MFGTQRNKTRWESTEGWVVPVCRPLSLSLLTSESSTLLSSKKTGIGMHINESARVHAANHVTGQGP